MKGKWEISTRRGEWRGDAARKPALEVRVIANGERFTEDTLVQFATALLVAARDMRLDREARKGMS